MELTDAELIAAVLRGDAASYEPLVSRYQSRLFAMARRYVRSESEAEDLVQDILIKAYQKLGSYRGEAPFEHWLMRLAVRACYDCLRSRRKETAFSELSEPEAAWLEGCAADAETPRHDADAARLAADPAALQIPPNFRYVPVAAPPANAGFTGASLQRVPGEATHWQATFAIRNYASQPRVAQVSVGYGGAQAGARRVTLAPLAETSLTFDIRATAAGWIEARLTPSDAMPADDSVTPWAAAYCVASRL